MAANTLAHNPRKPKTNAELVGIINRYWGQPVARIARTVGWAMKDGKRVEFNYETIASATRAGLPYGVTSLPRRA
jgi:hypothetical protein